MLIVNVASECGYTPQYQALQDLYEEFSDKLVIIGFPSNDYGSQEPGSHEEIRAFCTKRYGVSFPLTVKVSIQGPTPHPIYQWLMNKERNGVMDNTVEWNFNKFLLDKNGRLIKHLPSSVSPVDEKILDWLMN